MNILLSQRRERVGPVLATSSQLFDVGAIGMMLRTLCSPVMPSYFLWHAHSHQIADAKEDQDGS